MMKQRQVIIDFGYELVERTGDPHQPMFFMRGWFEMPDTGRQVTETVAAGSKKACQKLCAELIYKAIRDH